MGYSATYNGNEARLFYRTIHVETWTREAIKKAQGKDFEARSADEIAVCQAVNNYKGGSRP